MYDKYHWQMSDVRATMRCIKIRPLDRYETRRVGDQITTMKSHPLCLMRLSRGFIFLSSLSLNRGSPTFPFPPIYHSYLLDPIGVGWKDASRLNVPDSFLTPKGETLTCEWEKPRLLDRAFGGSFNSPASFIHLSLPHRHLVHTLIPTHTKTIPSPWPWILLTLCDSTWIMEIL
jgi:hypothetical protein